jgi:hypothetical protein
MSTAAEVKKREMDRYRASNDQIMCIDCQMIIDRFNGNLACACAGMLNYDQVVTNNNSKMAEYEKKFDQVADEELKEDKMEAQLLEEGVDAADTGKLISMAQDQLAGLHKDVKAKYVRKIAGYIKAEKLKQYIDMCENAKTSEPKKWSNKTLTLP